MTCVVVQGNTVCLLSHMHVPPQTDRQAGRQVGRRNAHPRTHIVTECASVFVELHVCPEGLRLATDRTMDGRGSMYQSTA